VYNTEQRQWTVTHKKYPNRPRILRDDHFVIVSTIEHRTTPGLGRFKCSYDSKHEQSREAAILTSNGTLECSCSYPTTMGLPCRHWMNVARSISCDHINLHHISKRWQLQALNNNGEIPDEFQQAPPPILISIADDYMGLHVPGYRHAPQKREDRYVHLLEQFKEIATLGAGIRRSILSFSLLYLIF
jgi:hypothetical protein